MMNLRSEMPTATRGVFSKNIVLAYLPSFADGFNVSIKNRQIWSGNDDRDRLHQVTSLDRLVGISSIKPRLIIMEDIFLSHVLRTDCIIIAHKQKVKMGWGRNRRTSTFSCISLHPHDQYSSLHHSTEGLLSSSSSRHSYLRPRPQRSAGGHVRSVVGCHHKETRPALLPSHSGRACSDSTYAGHHLLRPLLTTVLVVKK